MHSSRDARCARVADVLVERDADAVHLTSSPALSWLLDGARVAVPLGGAPVLSATVARDGTLTITTLANEANRLADEELVGPVRWNILPWHGSVGALPERTLTEADLSNELRALRASLSRTECERYRGLGRDTACAVTEVLKHAEPSWTERRLAGELAKAAYDIGAEPAVVLAAGESRGSVQHPIPTDARLGGRAMAVVTTVRHGLHASMTRWASFDGSGDGDSENRLREVEADIFAATRPGADLADVFVEIRRAYARHGFGDDAWTHHHQGGPTGYAGRDPKAFPGILGTVAENQAFAWNPWIPDAKLEDTVLATTAGTEPLTHDSDWPTTLVRGLERPLTLVR